MVRVLIIAVLGLSLMAPVALATQLDDKRNELQGIQLQLQVNKILQDAVKRNQTEILQKIQLNDQQIAQLQKDLFKLQTELTVTAARRQETDAKLGETQNQLQATQADLVITQEQLAKRREAYNKRLIITYKNGVPNALIFLLGSQDFKDLVGRIKLIAILTENDSRLMADLTMLSKSATDKITRVENEQRTIAGQRLSIVNDENRLKAVQNEIAAKQQALQNGQKIQQALFAQAQEEKVQLEEGESMLEASSNMIADEIRTIQLQQGQQPAQIVTLQSADSSGSGGSTLAGQSSMGFIWPVKGRITSPFGMRYHPVLGYSRMHTGIDLGVGSGTPVHAAKGGTIIMAGWMGGYGNAVVINHGGGISTLYGHNSALDVSVGQHVDQGQVISHSGSTGLSTGPHLHFEVRVNGNPQDPTKFLP